MPPRTEYAKNGDVHIACQVLGEGPRDLVYVPGWVSHVEYAWEDPSYADFLRRLSAFSRLIMFDKRGTGLSDRDVGYPTLEQRMDDVRAVMDAVGSERAAIFGTSDYPWAPTVEARETWLDSLERDWGEGLDLEYAGEIRPL